jgi:hypothetical protein
MPKKQEPEEELKLSLESDEERRDAEAFVQLMRRGASPAPEEESEEMKEFMRSLEEVYAEKDAEIEAKERAEAEAKGEYGLEDE